MIRTSDNKNHLSESLILGGGGGGDGMAGAIDGSLSVNCILPVLVGEVVGIIKEFN